MKKLKKIDFEDIIKNTKDSRIIDDSWESNSRLGGYRFLKAVIGKDKRKKANEVNEKMQKNRYTNEDVVEESSLIYTLHNIDKDSITVVELGAGRGDQCLKMAGLIDNTTLFNNIKKYQVLAIEGEPTHFEWTKKHFELQNLQAATAIHGAITDKDGEISFQIGDPSNWYGQSISETKHSSDSKSIKSYRLKTLLKNNNIDFVDFLHMDIQAEKLKVINDSLDILTNINFLYIATHSKNIHNGILEVMSNKNTHQIIANLAPNDITKFNDFGEVECQDGVLFYRLKEKF